MLFAYARRGFASFIFAHRSPLGNSYVLSSPFEIAADSTTVIPQALPSVTYQMTFGMSNPVHGWAGHTRPITPAMPHRGQEPTALERDGRIAPGLIDMPLLDANSA